MRTGFAETQTSFVSASQTARVLSEAWAASNMFCPACGSAKLTSFSANRPVADLFCEACEEQYELKSQSKPLGRKLANGAFATKIQRIESDTSPNLIIMHYDRSESHVRNLQVIPSAFFSHGVVEKRPPLKPTARRAGWVGSNILLYRIPALGRIDVITDRKIIDRDLVLERWQSVSFLRRKSIGSRGWLSAVLQCVDAMPDNEFSLEHIYAFEDELAVEYPQNSNIRPKIRQQLQVLRDEGIIRFLGRGRYKRVKP